jgi:allantoate deiminase
VKSSLSARRIKSDLHIVNESARTPGGGITRLSYSSAHIETLLYLEEQCHSLGARCFLDGAGNFIARIEGSEPGLRCFSFGSHVDSVKNGGVFDGIGGVVIGLEVFRLLREDGIRLRRPVQLFGFAEEEGVLFNSALVGSRFFTRRLSREDLLSMKNDAGISCADLADAFREKLAPRMDGEMPDEAGNPAFYLEPHIEQGPVLDRKGVALGVVSSITGTSMTDIVFRGEANHAGTTPMDVRKDPVRGLVHVSSMLDKSVRESGGAVGTIGRIAVDPNVGNVIPSSVSFTVDLRCVDERMLSSLLEELDEWCREAAREWSLDVSLSPGHRVMPLEMDAGLRRDLFEEAEKLGVPAMSLPSGAGHDALFMGGICPVGMVFIPSLHGKSHSPQEKSDYEHLGQAARVIRGVIERQDSKR